MFAAATTGEAAELAIALDALDACERDSVAFMRPDVLRAHANAAAIRGLPSEADDYLSEALDLARATEQHALAYGALHDLARLGDALRARRASRCVSRSPRRRLCAGACSLHPGRRGA